MNIKTKFRLLFWPVKAIIIIPALFLGIFAIPFFAILEKIDDYEEWCRRKSGMIIRNERGIEIYNPKYKE